MGLWEWAAGLAQMSIWWISEKNESFG
jgi:hypothetical protein